MKAAEIASKLAHEANQKKNELSLEEGRVYQDVLNVVEESANMGSHSVAFKSQLSPRVKAKLLQEGFGVAVPRNMTGAPVTISWPELK